MNARHRRSEINSLTSGNQNLSSKAIDPRWAVLLFLLAIHTAKPTLSIASPPSQERPQPKSKVDLEVQISFEFRTINQLNQGVWPTTKGSGSPTEGVLYIYLDTVGTTNEITGVEFEMNTPQNMNYEINYLPTPYFGIDGLGQVYDFFEGYQFTKNSLVGEKCERKLVPGQAVSENKAPIAKIAYQFKTNNPSSIGTFSVKFSKVLDINGNLVPHSVIPQTVVSIPYKEWKNTGPGIIQDKYYNTKGKQVYSLTVSAPALDSELSALQTSPDFSPDSWQYLGQHGPETWPGTYKYYDGFTIQFRSDSPSQFFRLVPKR